MKKIYLSFLIASMFLSCNPTPESKVPLTKEENMEWWQDARFGLFIHWGLYAIPAGEWKGEKIPGISEWIMLRGRIPVSDYESFAEDFNPVKFDADEWVRMAKEAGMKYIVITSKHHDGFAMFHSKTNPYNITDATPFDRDPLKELADACKKYGIKLGFYHSQAQDWNHPGGTYRGIEKGEPHWDSTMVRIPLDQYIDEKAYPQVEEILTNYGDISIIWWDTPIGMTEEAAEKLHTLLDLQPGIIENNRLYGPWNGDFSTPEQHIPPTGLDYAWEVCMTMNTSWGYKSYDDNWKSSKTLVQYLTDIVSKGGNFLLNVGPTAEGLFPEPSVVRLKEIGKWMNINNESIYGTTASPFFKLLWGRCTKKVEGDKSILYLHVFDWPENGKIKVPGLINNVKEVICLIDKNNVKFNREGDNIILDVSEIDPDPYNTVLKMTIDGKPEVISNLPDQDENGTVNLAVAYGFIHNRGYGEQAYLSNLTEDSYLENWISGGTKVEFMFNINDPGKFSISLEGATQADEIQVGLIRNDSKIECLFKGSGNMDEFTQKKIGDIEFEEAGIKVITLEANVSPWEQLRFKSLKLEKE